MAGTTYFGQQYFGQYSRYETNTSFNYTASGGATTGSKALIQSQPSIAGRGGASTVEGPIVNLNLTTGGTGYGAPFGGGTHVYTGVSLTGGSGSGATADITVTWQGNSNDGVVTQVTIVNGGQHYKVGDTLSANRSDLVNGFPNFAGGDFSVTVTTVKVVSALIQYLTVNTASGGATTGSRGLIQSQPSISGNGGARTGSNGIIESDAIIMASGGISSGDRGLPEFDAIINASGGVSISGSEAVIDTVPIQGAGGATTGSFAVVEFIKLIKTTIVSGGGGSDKLHLLWDDDKIMILITANGKTWKSTYPNVSKWVDHVAIQIVPKVEFLNSNIVEEDIIVYAESI